MKYDLKKGYYWLDRMIIRAFDKDGNKHKILRIYVDKDFNISFKTYKHKNKFQIESWQETAERHRDRLLRLEQDALVTTKNLLNKYRDYKPYICHSSGKDSTVLSNIVRQINSDIPILFNNTTNESADTYKFIKQYNNVKTLNPKETFWQFLERENFIPTRFGRACCRIYKHGLTLDNLNHDEKYLLFMGMRNEESNTRSDYQTEHQFDYYPDNWMCGLPIRQWNELDIWLYTILKKLPINNIYKKGYARCGCTICGFRSNLEWIMTKYYFPNLVKRFSRLQENNFYAYERWIGLNCTLDEFINKGAWKGGQYRPEPTEEVIDEFTKYKGLDREIAKKYFNKTCKKCGKNIRQKDVIAMNIKFMGRNINEFYCKQCFKKIGNMDEKMWKHYVKSFKNDGCELF